MRRALASLAAGAAALFAVHLAGVALFLVRSAQGGAAQVQEATTAIAPHLVLFLAQSGAAVALLGALFGLAAWILLGPFLRATPLRAALVTLALALLFGLRTLARRPALFEDALWRRGGVRAALQVALVEKLGAHALDRLLALLFIVWLCLALLRLRASRQAGPVAPSNARALLLAPRARPALLVALALVALAALFALRASRPRPARKRDGPPDLIVLAADSLRPDRFSSEGNPHATTPVLDALRAGGLWADDFFVPIASTTASWTTFATGLFPHHHGIRDLFPRDEQTRVRAPTLPRLLEARGYQTAVVSDYAGESFSRVDLGFQTVDAPPATTIEIVAEREAFQRLPLLLAFFSGPLGQRLFPVARYLPVNANPADLTERVLAQLGRLEASDQPFLLVAFYSVTHSPFAAPMPDAAAFTEPAYQGQSRYSYEIQQIDDIARAAVRPPEADIAQVRALYDGALRSFDREAGEVLRRLDRDGVTNRVIIVNGDHGEGLFEPGATTEHGKWFAGGEAANRTVMLLNGAGVKPGRVPAVTSGVDYLPTLLELAGVPAPAGPLPLDGLSLLHPQPPGRLVFAESTLWLGGDADKPPGAMSLPGVLDLLEVSPETHALVLKRRWQDRSVAVRLRAARRGPLELVYTPAEDALPRYQLFDLARDPFAEHDLFAQEPEVAEPLRRALLGFLRDDPLRWLDALERTQERLEQ